MRRLLPLVTLAFVVSLFLAPFAVAQEEEMEPPQEEAMEEAMEPQPEPPFAEEKQMEKAKMEKAKAKEMPKTGGPSVSLILPAAALLLVGSGVLAYAVVRRR